MGSCNTVQKTILTDFKRWNGWLEKLNKFNLILEGCIIIAILVEDGCFLTRRIYEDKIIKIYT